MQSGTARGERPLFLDWDLLAEHVIPPLCDLPSTRPAQVWARERRDDAIAVVVAFAEVVGPKPAARVRAYTPFQEGAASFQLSEIAGVPAASRQRWFRVRERRYVPEQAITEAVVIGEPSDPVDLVVAKLPREPDLAAETWRQAVGSLRAGGLLLVDTPAGALAADLLPVDPDGRLFRKQSPLSQAEQLARAAFDAVPMPVVAVDSDLRIVGASDAARRAFGIHAGTLGSSVRLLQRGVAWERLWHGLRAFRSGGGKPTLSVEWPSGSRRRWEVRFSDLPVPGAEPGVVITFLDDTEAYHLRLAAVEHEHRLDTARRELDAAGRLLDQVGEDFAATVDELRRSGEEVAARSAELDQARWELEALAAEVTFLRQGLGGESTRRLGELRLLARRLCAQIGAVALLDTTLEVRAWAGAGVPGWEGAASERELRLLPELAPTLGLSPEAVIAAATGDEEVPEEARPRGTIVLGAVGPLGWQAWLEPLGDCPTGPYLLRVGTGGDQR